MYKTQPWITINITNYFYILLFIFICTYDINRCNQRAHIGDPREEGAWPGFAVAAWTGISCGFQESRVTVNLGFLHRVAFYQWTSCGKHSKHSPVLLSSLHNYCFQECMMLHQIDGSHLINPFLLAVCITTIVLSVKPAKEVLCIPFQKWGYAF